MSLISSLKGSGGNPQQFPVFCYCSLQDRGCGQRKKFTNIDTEVKRKFSSFIFLHGNFLISLFHNVLENDEIKEKLW